ncbi:hypothetical protein [Hymenobacter crusticola]|uniref:Uncharacterized protein n=1 Tax=Hymenobacter crusticola TaxID=1770526 RepID=A0A243W5W6_9BACT|nr:hypothetical protein [Hymenobacter crusticola]OUJ68673.1 hypothetical protein BXP70_27685 [Hymenobacter crusticola]
MKAYLIAASLVGVGQTTLSELARRGMAIEVGEVVEFTEKDPEVTFWPEIETCKHVPAPQPYRGYMTSRKRYK